MTLPKRYSIIAFMLLVGVYTLFFIGVRAYPSGIFSLRKQLVRLPITKSLFFLSASGDSRFVFLNKPIVMVTLYTDKDRTQFLDAAVLESLTQSFRSLYKVRAEFSLKSVLYPPHAVWSVDDMKIFERDNRDGDISVFFANRFEDNPDILSQTFGERSIYIYTDPLIEYTPTLDDEKVVVVGALLRGMGSLLGMNAVANSNCILSDVYHDARVLRSVEVSDRPQQMCPEDKDEYTKALL